MAAISQSSSSPSPLALRAILVLALLSAVAPLATDMYLPGFPAMAADLGSGAAGIQMTLTSFLLGLAAGQLLIGPISDRFGRRGPLLIGTAVAVLSGILCVLAPNVESLVLLRLLQGLGGAAGVVLARAVIADRAPDAVAAARLFQLMMMITGVAPRSREAMDSSMLQNTVIASARPAIRSAPGPTSHCSFTKRRQATPVTVAALIKRRRISRAGSGIRTNETMSANSVIPTVATKRQS